MRSKENQRRVRLIVPALQVELTTIFVGMAALSLLLQGGLDDGAALWSELRAIRAGAFLTSVIAFLPVMFVVGIFVTFRFAGPMHRLEEHPRSIVRGEEPIGVTLHRGDELQEVARLLNEALAVTRAKAALPASAVPSREGQETAA